MEAKQARSQETRDLILKTSLRLFGANGFDATGVAEICGAASVSKGAFYHHFKSKQEVFLKLMEDWLTEIERSLQGIVEEAPSVSEALVRMASLTRRVFQDADGSMSFFLQFWTKASGDPLVWNRTIEPYRRFQELFVGIIRKGVEDGEFKPVDPRLIAQVLLSFAIGLVVQGIFVPQGEHWDKVAEDAVKLMVSAIRR